MPAITDINRQIVRLIGQSASPTILGLLPVEIEIQDACLANVRDYVSGDFQRLNQNFRYFPAATAYAVAVSIGRGMTDANFYNALRDQLSLEISATERNALSIQFSSACSDLGMVMPPKDDDTHTDRNLRPIIFQAGILPYWVEHLAPAVMGYLDRNACPDLEDELQVVRFARLLADRVPAGHARLQRTLKSIVGPLVTSAILRAFSTSNFDQLPPHLRDPIREAKRKTGAESIKSPFLRIRRETGELVLVLPRQSSRLADYNSYWLVGATNHRALIERELDVVDLGAETIQVQLLSLRAPFQDQTFSVKLVPDAKEPFFLFRASDGRRLFTGDRVEIDLSLGDYDVLLCDGVSTNEDEVFEIFGKHRSARIEVFPGRNELKMLAGDRMFTLRPRLGADLLIQDRAGNRMVTLEGRSIYYGASLEIHAFTPGLVEHEVEPMEFKIECLEVSDIPAKSILAQSPSQRGAYEFYDLTEALTQPFLAGLPSGIFNIQISAEGKTRNFSRKLIYWKGFHSLSSTFGFRCETPPRNFDASISSGLIATAQGMKLAADHIGAEVVLGIKQPTEAFSMAKPGLWLSLCDTDQHEYRPVQLGRSVEANPMTRQSLIVESGDVLPWKITCQGTTIVTLKPGQPKCSLNLNSMLAQFGDVGRLQATSQTGAVVELVTFTKANLIRHLEVDWPPGSLTYAASFKLGQSQLQQLEVTLTNFADPASAVLQHVIDLVPCTIPVQGLGTGDWQITAEGSDWNISLAAKITEISAGIHFVDFRARRNPEDDWQPLKVADTHSLSESRLVLIGPPLVEATDPWTKLITSVCGAFHNGSMFNHSWLTFSDREMAITLGRLQEAVLFKYASVVWPSIKWLENAVSAVCQNFFDLHIEGMQKVFASFAVTGLERRCESGLNVHSILIFGCQSKLLSVKGEMFCSVPPLNSLVTKVFIELGKVSLAPSLRDYAWNGGQLNTDFLAHFGNFAAVAINQAKEFSEFNYQNYFKQLGINIQELDFQQAHTSVDAFLSPSHFLSAIRPLNRRFRPLEQVRSQDQPSSAMSRMVGDIQAVRGQVDQVALAIKAKLNVAGYVDFWVPITVAESEMVQAVSDILLVITAMARLNTAGLMSRAEYKLLLKTLLSPESKHLDIRIRRLCLLQSLAPELFAFYMLFWEAVIKPKAKS